MDMEDPRSYYIDLSGEDGPSPGLDRLRDLDLQEAAFRARERIRDATRGRRMPDPKDTKTTFEAALRSMELSSGGVEQPGDQLYALWYENPVTAYIKIGRSYGFWKTRFPRYVHAAKLHKMCLMDAWLSPPVKPLKDEKAAEPWEDRLKKKLVEYEISRDHQEYFHVLWDDVWDARFREGAFCTNDRNEDTGITFSRVVSIAKALRDGDVDVV
ncbi:hypothetical protein ACWFR1_23065 [Streptomyces sp. NPDC055103]